MSLKEHTSPPLTNPEVSRRSIVCESLEVSLITRSYPRQLQMNFKPANTKWLQIILFYPTGNSNYHRREEVSGYGKRGFHERRRGEKKTTTRNFV